MPVWHCHNLKFLFFIRIYYDRYMTGQKPDIQAKIPPATEIYYLSVYALTPVENARQVNTEIQFLPVSPAVSLPVLFGPYIIFFIIFVVTFLLIIANKI